MQVTETERRPQARAEGHHPPGRAQPALPTRLDEVKDQVQLKGFRKGKVPVAHLKKLFGRSLMAEVLQEAVEETSRKAINERNERAAHQPNIDLTEDKDEIEQVLSGQSDLAFTMSFEVLPEIKVTDLAALKLEREVAEVTPEAVDKAVGDLVERAHPLRGGGRARRRRGRPRHRRLRRPHRRQRVRGRQGRGRADRARPVAVHPGLRRGHHGRQGRRGARRQCQVPRRLSGEGRWPARSRVHGQGQGGGQADPPRDRRRVRQDAGRREPGQAQGAGARPRSPASTPPSPA